MVLDIGVSQVVEEDLVTVIGVQIFKLFIDLRLKGSALVVDLSKLLGLLTLLLLGCFKLSCSLLGLLFDIGKELEEVLSILLKHLLGAHKTELTHLIEVGKTLNFLVFLLKQHLHQEHLPLLLDEVPPILTVLRSLDRHIETGSLRHVDLIRDIWVDG